MAACVTPALAGNAALDKALAPHAQKSAIPARSHATSTALEMCLMNAATSILIPSARLQQQKEEH